MGIFIGRVFAAVAVALLLAACQSDEQKLAEHMRRGDAYFEEGQFGEAIIEYRSAIQIDPNDGAAHFNLYKAYMRNKKLKEGFWELREAVRLDPQNLTAKEDLAQLLRLGGEFEEALTNVDAVIAAEPERFKAHIVRGQILASLNRDDEALEAFKTAAELAPDSWEAVTQYAYALERGGDSAGAERQLVSLVERAPEWRSHLALAAFLARTADPKRIGEARAAYDKAIAAAEPDERPRVYLELARFLLARDLTDDAIAVLEEGIAESEDKLDLIYALARIHLSQGNHEQADVLMEKAATAAPDQARPLLTLSAYRDQQGDLEGALEAAKQAVQVEPGNADARLREAEVMIEIGVKEKQEDLIADGLQRVEALLKESEAENPGALVVKAKVDLYYRRFDEAIASLRSAINARPEWGQAHFVLGTVLAMKGDNNAARSELARALEIDPSLLQARRVLAQVHAELNENEYVVEEGRRYLRERPGDTPLRILVAQSLNRLGQIEAAERELAMIPEAERTAEVNYAYGRIALGKRNYDQARTFLLAALAELPTNYDILNSLYLIDLRNDQVEQSVARIAAALEAEPDNARLHLLQGTIALRQRRGEDAEANFKKAIELQPRDLAAYEHLAQYYATTGRLQQAIETYEAAKASRPELPQTYHMLGVLYELGGKREKAIENYDEAVRRAPNLGEAKNNLAYLLVDTDTGRDLDRALELAQEAKALLPDSANAADTLGWVLFKRGVPGAAIAYLKEAENSVEPGSPSLGIIRYHLAQAYAANGDDDEAAATLERALAEIEHQVGDARKRGAPAEEPEWAAEARAMLARLQSS